MVNRRDFLKLTSLLPLLRLSSAERQASPQQPNILVLVFDTWAAMHCSLYGYARQTTPNLARFAEQATVFHNHISAGNFTISGTSSLLTGTHPWTHRGLHPNGTVTDAFADQNLFSQFSDRHRLGFSHNLLVNILLHQFGAHLDEFVLPREVALTESQISDELFPNDYGTAVISERTLLKPVGELPNSLFGYLVAKIFQDRKETRWVRQLKDKYPRGITRYHDLVYLLEDSVDWTVQRTANLQQPYLAYFHMMPPHSPYTPRHDFVDIFLEDGLTMPAKPEHFFSEGRDQDFLTEKSRFYDEYVAFVDAELGRLLDALEAAGTLENTWVVVTSDHGELFERGIYQHITPVLYHPLIHVPLLIHAPGQQTRQDVTTATSSVDVLPTLLHVTGKAVPDWIEGQVLPPYGGADDPARAIFVIEAKQNPKSAPLNKATFSLMKGRYKLIYYRGYEGLDERFELYDLQVDPEELQDLAAVQTALAGELLAELKAALDTYDRPNVGD